MKPHIQLGITLPTRQFFTENLATTHFETCLFTEVTPTALNIARRPRFVGRRQYLKSRISDPSGVTPLGDCNGVLVS